MVAQKPIRNTAKTVACEQKNIKIKSGPGLRVGASSGSGLTFTIFALEPCSRASPRANPRVADIKGNCAAQNGRASLCGSNKRR